MLNKKGWSLTEMIILSSILALFLIISIIYISRLYNDIGIEPTNEYYYNLEDKLEEQAEKYLSNYYNEELSLNEIIIKKSTLRNYNLDITLLDENGNTCVGYVKARKGNMVIISNGYIKCPNYTTIGYESENE